MAKFVGREGAEGFLPMSKKATGLGKPRSQISSKSGSISKQDNRGKDKACLKG